MSATLLAGMFALAAPTSAPASTPDVPAAAGQPSTNASRAVTPQLVTSGQGQCSKPVSSRTGHWACPVATPSLGAAADHGFCTYQGCWSVLDSVRTTHKGTITYGYGKTRIGSGTFYFKTTATGARNVSDWFYFVASRGTRQTKLEAERLYLSTAHPSGHSISPRKYTSKTCGPRSAQIKCRFPSGEARSYDSRVAWYTIKHKATWSDASSAYPGRWFVIAKSVKYRRSSTGKSYIADGRARRPENPATSGYLP